MKHKEFNLKNTKNRHRTAMLIILLVKLGIKSNWILGDGALFRTWDKDPTATIARLDLDGSTVY